MRDFCLLCANAGAGNAGAVASCSAVAGAGLAAGAAVAGSSTGAVNLAGIGTLTLAALVAAAGSERNSHNGGENQCNLFHFSIFLYCETISPFEKSSQKYGILVKQPH